MEYYLNRMKSAGMVKFWGNLRLSAFLACKAIIKGNRWTLILLVLVVSFSFVNLIFISSLISGVMTTMENQLVDTVFSNIVINPEEDAYYIDKVSQLEAKLEQVPGIAGISPRLSTSAFIEYRWKEKKSQTDKGQSGTWEVVGIDPLNEANVTTIPSHIIEGNYLDENDRDEIVLGVEVAGGDEAANPEFLTLGGVKVGEKVRLTYPNGIQREYTVKGIFRVKEMTRADRLVFVTRNEMISVLGRQAFCDRASQILIRVKPGVHEDSVIEDLGTLGIKEEIRNWEEYGSAQLSVVSTFDIIGGLIGGLGLVIAAVVLFIIIYISVLNRKRQIGILRAIGIPHIAIIGSYPIQALFYAIAGIVLGWLIAEFGLQQYFVFHPIDLPIGLVGLNIETKTIVGSTLGLIAATTLAGFIPAWIIMRESIIKTIWGT
jgi:putative ABC transport system permease protein